MVTEETSYQQMLTIMSRIAAESQRTNERLIDSVQELSHEVRAMRRELIRAPLSVIGVTGAATMFWFGQLSEIGMGAAVIIFLSPFYPEGINLILSKYKKHNREER